MLLYKIDLDTEYTEKTQRTQSGGVLNELIFIFHAERTEVAEL